MAILTTTESNLLNALTFRRDDEGGIDLGNQAFNGETSVLWNEFNLYEAEFSGELEFESIEALTFFDEDPLSAENMSVLFAATDTLGSTNLFVQSYDTNLQPIELTQVDVSGVAIDGYQEPDYQSALMRTPGSESINPTETLREEIVLHTDATEGSAAAIDPDNTRNPNFDRNQA